MVELTYPNTVAANSTATSLPSVNGEKINAFILDTTKKLGEMAKSLSDTFTNSEDCVPSPEVWSESDSGLGIDMSYNISTNVSTISKPVAIDNSNKHPGKRISLAEAYEKAGHLYEKAEAKRQVLREQEARLFFGLLEDE
ncbi:MAG: hypothetical protein KAH38_09875 [Candidatus Hydrogenedentes bacterium]|nr:hypothetical protein [Candidatus Hydrogenedentota bacterium]